MRLSLGAFASVALMEQARARHGRSVCLGFGEMMARIYREFRIKNKFYEVV